MCVIGLHCRTLSREVTSSDACLEERLTVCAVKDELSGSRCDSRETNKRFCAEV